ncbi:MAG: helix-turn-helix domain-containing protein [Verrucomicrobiales bacterium]
MRVQEAQRLLTTTSDTVGNIALASGFYNQSHLTRYFRKRTGMTPLAFRRQFRD